MAALSNDVPKRSDGDDEQVAKLPADLIDWDTRAVPLCGFQPFVSRALLLASAGGTFGSAMVFENTSTWHLHAMNREFGKIGN